MSDILFAIAVIGWTVVCASLSHARFEAIMYGHSKSWKDMVKGWTYFIAAFIPWIFIVR